MIGTDHHRSSQILMFHSSRFRTQLAQIIMIGIDHHRSSQISMGQHRSAHISKDIAVDDARTLESMILC